MIRFCGRLMLMNIILLVFFLIGSYFVVRLLFIIWCMFWNMILWLMFFMYSMFL